MKLLVIATNLNRKELWLRWEYLREKFEDIDVTLLVPARFEVGTRRGYTFGKKEVFKGCTYDEKRFHVVPICVEQDFFGDWYSKDIKKQIRKIKPDFVYYIGVHSSRSLTQAIHAGHKVHAKVCVFTMRGDLEKNPPRNLKQALLQATPSYLNKKNVMNSDAIFVHYPDAVAAFQKEGYTGPLYINTQIGVDTNFFRFIEDGRQRVRKELGLEGCFVFGSASRLSEEKGVIDTIRALPQDPKVKYLILGNGTKEDLGKIQKAAEECRVSCQIVMPGLIGWDELCDYLSAMDCAVHVPHRTPHWVETFSLALVQEMSVGLPVIGSRSGSVPYQIGDETYLIKDGSVEQLREKMKSVMEDQVKAKEVGMKNRRRCIDCFDSRRIAVCLGIVLHELQEGVYNLAHIDTAETWQDVQ